LEIMPIQENMYYSAYFHGYTNVYIFRKKGRKRQGNVTKSGKGDTMGYTCAIVRWGNV
jgi:hypothetical protein